MVQHHWGHMLRHMRKILVAVATGLMAWVVPQASAADESPRLEVVTTFSILGDMVKEIGGRHVNVVTMVGPNADTHTFEPAPQEVQMLASAQVLVSNGLGLETWLPRMVAAAGFSGVHIVASDGARLRTYAAGHDHDHGDGHGDGHDQEHDQGNGQDPGAATQQADADQPDQVVDPHAANVDPHAWQNLENGMVYARNIADGLSKADPLRAHHYQRRVRKYLATMEKLDAEIRSALAVIPVEHREAVVAHDAFGYFGDAYEVTFIPLAALGDTAEPSAQDVARVIDQMRALDRAGVFPESISNPRLLEQLAREADVVVGGPLYSDALDDADQPAGTYLGMFHWNAGQLISTLRPDDPARSRSTGADRSASTGSGQPPAAE